MTDYTAQRRGTPFDQLTRTAGHTAPSMMISDYRRGYLAGRALARRGRQEKAIAGRPRRSDTADYQRGYQTGLNAKIRHS